MRHIIRKNKSQDTPIFRNSSKISNCNKQDLFKRLDNFQSIGKKRKSSERKENLHKSNQTISHLRNATKLVVVEYDGTGWMDPTRKLRLRGRLGT